MQPVVFFALPRKALQAAALLGDHTAALALERMSENFRQTLWALAATTAIVMVTAIIGHTIDVFHTSTSAVETTQAETEGRLTSERLKYAAELRLAWIRSCQVTPEQAVILAPADAPTVNGVPRAIPHKE